MTPTDDETHAATRETTRRSFLRVAVAGVLVGGVASIGLVTARRGRGGGGNAVPTLRWGVVGTGSIANSMAAVIDRAAGAELAAVSSRSMDTAREYADRHGVAGAFDSWADMIASDAVDAIYVATPTSVREEICVAAARGGRHVLGEKPFASLPSVRRILAACRENDVAFMDGTHFPHHPRTHEIRTRRDELVGTTWSVASAFQFNLADRSNIRYDPDLEPMGAIGDAGWYNMRAAVEYLPAGADLEGAATFLRRDVETGAVIGGSGVLRFSGGATSTWDCGFDSAARVADLRISGTEGVVSIDDFLTQNPDGSADYRLRRGRNDVETVNVPSSKPGSVSMFEDVAAAAADPTLRERWMNATERTQTLLDAAWRAGLESENGV
ncbi:MAG: Gfo/Idh/MocA family oxidoreductase [Gemmatimonadota bacterium]|nr:Gfo/Idh/MocA family oxidoreductase [Gemmatimonadota bacterium]